MKRESYAQTFLIPGTDRLLQVERAESGRLLSLTAGGRCYVEERADGRHFDGGLAVMAETLIGRTLLRRVSTPHGSWVERYAWGAGDRLVEVDGVTVERDERLRVVACRPEGETGWRYRYNDDGPVRIDGPHGRRGLRWRDGRPAAITEDHHHRSLRYDGESEARTDVPLPPAGWQRDELGRVWTITDGHGRVMATYLWDGFACLGRIDGPPGDPLAAVFSLDPTCTPVRVITPAGVTRIPRDAYGEGLLAHPGVPGLYGGLVSRGFVYLPARALDPRTGAFAAPDPYDGLAADPRRAAGYDGPLLTEREPAGPYAISRHDPIGRADPTGNLSFWVYLSDFTWSLGNNLVGWFGLDWVINFFGSLFTGQIGDFFDFEHLESSSRLGLTGVRRDGVTAPGRVWTFQHLVMSPRASIHDLARARVVDPRAAFRPTLYGTVLQVRPVGEAPLLLRGTAFTGLRAFPNGPVTWSRAGGPAEPVVPGAPTPIFPQGGLHFDMVVNRIENPADATLRELEGRTRSVLGTVAQRTVIPIQGVSTGLAVDQNVLLSDQTGAAAIFRLLSVTPSAGILTRVRLDTDAPGVGPDNVRLRRLEAPDPAENLSQTTLPTHLETQGSNGAYRPGHAIRLSQGGSVVGARVVDRLEARLALDAAVPDPFSPPMLVLTATVSGGQVNVTRTADADGLSYPGGTTPPGVGTTLVVRGGGAEVPAVVREVAGQVVRVDRPLTAAGGNGAAVRVQLLARGTELGRREGAREPDPQLTYAPAAVRSAPASGFIRLEDNDGRLAVRRVTGRTFDAIVAGQNLPGNTANPYSVERFEPTGFDQSGLSITTEQVLALSENVDLGTPPALMVQQLSGADLAAAAAGTAVPGWTNGGDRLTATFATTTAPPAFPGPAAPLFVEGGAAREMRRVQAIRSTVTVDRELTVPAGPEVKLKVVALTGTGRPIYAARLVGPIVVTLPAGHGLAAGNNVDLNFSPAAATFAAAYRATPSATDGRLAAEGGPPHAVRLTRGATNLDGTLNGELQIAITPQIGAQPVQMPRLRPEAVVEVTWDAAATPLKVSAVDGTRVTLTHREAGPLDLYLKTVSLRQMVPADPGTGTAYHGLNGRPEGGTAVSGGQARTTRLSFDVWSPNGLSKGTLLAVTDGSRTLPCRIPASSDIAVTITLDRNLDTAATPLSIVQPVVSQTGFGVDFVREDRAIVLRDNPALLGATGSDLVWVTPLVPAVEAERLADGARVNPGTVHIPEDPENWELDRRQSLIDHELIHTRQSAAWGPLLLGWFPLFALEGLLEGTTNIEEPDYSPFRAATISSEGGGRRLRIPDPGGITFARGDDVQFFPNGTARTVRLGAETEAGSRTFAVALGADVPDQDLSVRKVLNDGGWAAFRDTIFNIQQVLTHGGVLNMLTGSIYGGFFHGIGRLFYALGRAIFGKGDRFPATVPDGDKTSVTLTTEAGTAALRGANRIIVQKGDSTVVRSLTAPAAGSALTLSAALEFSGDVFVAPYTTHTPDSAWDWNSYHPAQVISLEEPAAIQVLSDNGDTLTLKPFDRVVVTSGTRSLRTNVTHVRNTGVVELQDAPPFSGEQRDLRIAKIDEGDPMGNVDSIALRELGFGWMRWLFDPYGQFQFRLQPENDSFWGIVARIARYLFGTTSWSLIFPFGYYFWDNAFVQSGGNGHFSQMEQEASAESGDLYSPIGRLRGGFRYNGDTKRHEAVVGDIARYWYFHGSRTATLILGNRIDTPGVGWVESGGATGGSDGLRIIPDVTGGAAASVDPNKDAQPSGNAQGLVVPDVFFSKNPTNPLNATATGPAGFTPAFPGYLPASANLERSFGMYVSFCRPGRHRVTVRNGITSATDAFDAQEGSSTFGFGRQTIYFTVDAADVGVTIGGRPVASTLTADGSGNQLPETIDLVQLQRARVEVSPNGARRYAITVPNGGRGGFLHTPTGTVDLIAMNRNTPANEPEPVEISRVYRKGTDGSYDDAVLNAHGGAHLQGDIHIPVRLFRVRVVNTLPVRRAVTLDPADILDPNAAPGKLRPGDSAFVIIPADPTGTLRRTAVSYPSSPALVSDPRPPEFGAETTPPALAGFVGDGVITRITLQPDNPPEAAARMVFTVEVGFDTLRANLTAEIEVIPRLTLEPAAGLAVRNNGSSIAFNARDEGGAAANIRPATVRLLEADGTTPAAGLSAAVAGATVTITAAAAATPGRKQVLVEKDSGENHWARRTFEVTT